MDILRFITAGSVDDGKSTLIGRLLSDTGNIMSDVLRSVSAGSSSAVNLAFVTDGLRSERQQGITIDIAYKYFTTQDRKFIVTDAPGHFQFTKNLVTGASEVDVMIILIDAKNGITEQTRRHTLVAAFLQIRHVVVAINKMDLVSYSEQVFEEITSEYVKLAGKLHIQDITFIPMSALAGDNVVDNSVNMGWYRGYSLMDYLNKCPSWQFAGHQARYSVQCAVAYGKKEGYLGKVWSGTFKTKDIVRIFPDNVICQVAQIMHDGEDVKEARAGQNICLFFTAPGMARRGDTIAHLSGAPKCGTRFTATICWLDNQRELVPGKQYILRIQALETTCSIKEVLYKIDVNTFEHFHGETLAVNEFARVIIETKYPVVYDLHSADPQYGRGVIIDIECNSTSGGFIIED